ncbi:hypothetical protein H4R20_002942, partial [Coemansia guatemalensis]
WGHALASPVSAPPLHANGGFHNAQGAPHPNGGFHTATATTDAHAGINEIPPPQSIAAHPVRLASIPQSTKNAYLSDSSGDNASDVSSLGGSDSTSSSASVDTFYGAASTAAMASTTEARTAPGFASSPAGGDMPRSALQRTTSISRRIDALQAAGNDSSSESSAKSQSSSKRRVRFQETVSVVFNTRHSTAEDDGNYPSDSDNDSSNASVDMPAALNHAKAPDANGCSTTSASVTASSAFAADDAFDDAGALGHSRYQIPASVAVQIGTLLWPDVGAISAAASSSHQASGASSRNGSPDDAKRRRQRPKHRVETQPLRDREAERELQLRKGLAARNHETAVEPVEPVEPRSSADTDTVTATQATAEPPAEPESVEEAQAADPMTEARRALLGHYHVPNPMLPVGNSIPRSTTTALPRTSSVKVVRAQSLSRPQNRYSASAGATQAKNDSWRGLRGPRRGQSVSSTQHGQSNADKSNTDQGNADRAADHKPAAPAAKESHTRLVSRTAPTQDIGRRDSHEFDFTNVLESFSTSSFELFEGKQGGVHIRYSDRESSRKPPNASSELLADNAADNSDGDDIPLSAIVRSRSEPAQNHSRRPGANSLAASAASTRQNKLQERMLVRSSGSFRNRSEDSRPVPAATRSTSMDVAHQQTSDTSKRRFSRWGNIF